MKILIINCDLDPVPETNEAELLRDFFVEEEIIIKNACKDDFPTEKEIISAETIIITGSRAHIYDNHDWVKEIYPVLKIIDALEKPTLAICFGGDLVTEQFGGKIINSGSFEEGFQKIELTDEGKSHFLFDGFPNEFKAYESHWDIIEKLPGGAVVLAQNDFSLQAFVLKNFFCVQFHPDILSLTAQKMAVRDGKDVNLMLNGIGMDYRLPLKILQNFIDHFRK